MMQVGTEDLDQELARRARRWAPPAGVEYVRATGVQGLREAGVLKGVRAMAARVFGGEGWYVSDEGGTGRVECLYEGKRRGRREVKFIVARLVDRERWEAGRVAATVGAGARAEGAAAGTGVGGGGAPEPDLHHTGPATEHRCPVGPLSHTPMGDIQRAGVAGEDCGARAAADAKAAAAAEGGRAEMAAAYRVPVGPLGDIHMGVIQRTVETGGARGERAAADMTGADKDGRKRDRGGGADDMDQGGGKRRTRGGGTTGGVKRKRGDG